MTNSPDHRHPSRRAVLRGLQAAALVGGGIAASRAFGQDATLEALIDQNQGKDFGQGFDSGSRTIQMPKASLPTLSPATVQHTEQAIAQFESIVAKGGWPEVVQSDRLRLGSRHPAVTALRQRLTISGDLDANAGGSDIYDSYVEAGVRRFQARHGITIDGVVRGETGKALNVPAAVRLAQLRTNLTRLRSMSGNLGPRHVVANIPAARIEAIEGGVAVSRHTAVVGKPDRPSPDINSRVIEINFNPFWTVPASIVRKDLIPKMQAEPDYLVKNHIRIFDQRGGELTPAAVNWYSEEATNYMFKQDPGDCSLGSLRINRRSDVYMRHAAQEPVRRGHALHSSGCVRVQGVRELVNWLLVETLGWSRQEIDQVIVGRPQGCQGRKPVPLYWVYVTAWATPDGAPATTSPATPRPW